MFSQTEMNANSKTKGDGINFSKMANSQIPAFISSQNIQRISQNDKNIDFAGERQYDGDQVLEQEQNEVNTLLEDDNGELRDDIEDDPVDEGDQPLIAAEELTQ